jgi:tRNA(Ile)-lysidine synthase
MPAGMIEPIDTGARLRTLFAPLSGVSGVGLAVSGGADSLALMVLAARWRDTQASAPDFFVYSLDHGLRPEAAEEVAAVCESAARYGLTARALRWAGDKPESGVQAAARAARYGLIGAAMRADGCTVLLTAHHRRDQAETVLMRLAHGSGVEGLRGMDRVSEVEGVTVMRPLLDVDPEELAELVAREGLVPVADPSNADRDYERVRWRQALPGLAGLGLDAETLARFARRMGEADAALGEIADAAFDAVVALDGFGAAEIDRASLRKLSPAIGQRVLARALRVVGGRQKPNALAPVEALAERLRGDEEIARTTLLGAILRADAEMVVLAREPGRMRPADSALAPGTAITWDRRFRIVNHSDADAFTAGLTDYLPRHRLRDVLGFKVMAPAEAIRTAPVVRDAGGAVLALGAYCFDARVTVDLLRD